MQAKGTAVESIPRFVRSAYPGRYDEWLESLSPDSQKIFRYQVLPSSWYPLEPAVVEPTHKICDLFYGGRETGAWKAGEFSAETSLKGIYKVFVQVGTPRFIIKRASTVFSSYYSPSTIEVADESAKHVVVHITDFAKPSPMVEGRIAGWIKKALEISGCRNPRVSIDTSLARGDDYTCIRSTWN